MNKRRLSQASLHGLDFQFAFSRAPGKSKMVKTSNQAIFILVCFWLGAALHEQETAQSGQFAQTSNLLFLGHGSDFQFVFCQARRKQKAQTSNLLFPGPGKSKMVQIANLLFPNPGKKAIGSLKSNCSCSVARSPT